MKEEEKIISIHLAAAAFPLLIGGAMAVCLTGLAGSLESAGLASARSSAIFTAACFAGMGLMGVLVARIWTPRTKRPLFVTALTLIGSALFLVLGPLFWVSFVPGVMGAAGSAVDPGSISMDIFRLVFLSILLSAAVISIGGVPPLFGRVAAIGKKSSRLISSMALASLLIGAAIGKFAAGYWTSLTLGYEKTTWAGSAILGLVSLVIIIIPSLRDAKAASEEIEEIKDGQKRGANAVFLFALFLAGTGAAILLSTWRAVLVLAIGTSVYSSVIISTAALTSAALGNLLALLLFKKFNKASFISGALLLSASFISTLTLWIYPWIAASAFKWDVLYRENFISYMWVKTGAAFLLIGLPGLLFGASVGFAARYEGEKDKFEKWGLAALFFGIGLGLFTVGGFIIPSLGYQRAIAAGASLFLIGGAAMAAISGSKVLLKVAAPAACAAALAALFMLSPSRSLLLLNGGPYLYSSAFEGSLAAGEDVRDSLSNFYRMRFFQAGEEGAVSVLELRVSEEKLLRLDGRTIYSSKADVAGGLLRAHLPILAHPAPKKMAIMGLGSGVTAGGALLYPLERVDVAEPSSEMIYSLAHFLEVSGLASKNDSRLRIIKEGFLDYLAGTDETYDVISAKGPSPSIKGAGAYYGLEFFETARNRLEPGGVFFFSVPLYEFDPDSAMALLRTFASIFPNCSMWESSPGGDEFLLGKADDSKIDLANFLRRSSLPQVREDLARIKVKSGEDLFARFVMGPIKMAQAGGQGPRISGDRRVLEYLTPRYSVSQAGLRYGFVVKDVLSHHESAQAAAKETPDELKELFDSFDRTRTLYYWAAFRLIDPSQGGDQIDVSINSLREALSMGQDYYPREYVGAMLADRLIERAETRLASGDAAGAVKDWSEAFEADQEGFLAGDRLIAYHVETKNWKEADRWSRKNLYRFPKDPLALATQAQIQFDGARYKEAIELYNMAVESAPFDPLFRWRLALAYASIKELDKAEKELRTVLQSHPSNVEAWILLSNVLKDKGEIRESEKYRKKAEKEAPDHPMLNPPPAGQVELEER